MQRLPENGSAILASSRSRAARLSAHAGVTTLLCVLFALMYLDRVNISAAAAPIKAQFGLTNTEMGLAFSAFSWTYLASVLFGGWGARRFGAKTTLLVCVAVVGAGTMLTGLAGGLAGLVGARLLVGLGEGPAFPAATQAMRNWYPADRFGTIQGITHSASRFGAALAPPVVASIVVWFDWHVAFLVCGATAFVWAAVWWRYFRDDPREHPHVRARNLEGVAAATVRRRGRVPFWALTRRMFPVTLVMVAYGWSYWMFVSWLPLYFQHQYGTDLRTSALLSSVPFLAGVGGNFAGGALSDLILKRTGRQRLARCSVVAGSLLGAAAFLLPSILLRDLAVVVPLLALAMFCLEMTIAPMYAMPMDMSKEYSGLGSAYIIMGVAIAGIVSPVVFGWLIDATGNWNVPFATGIAILLGGVLVTATLRPDRPFEPGSPIASG